MLTSHVSAFECLFSRPRHATDEVAHLWQTERVFLLCSLVTWCHKWDNQHWNLACNICHHIFLVRIGPLVSTEHPWCLTFSQTIKCSMFPTQHNTSIMIQQAYTEVRRQLSGLVWDIEAAKFKIFVWLSVLLMRSQTKRQLQIAIVA